MNENTNDVLKNGENDEQELERLRTEVEAEIEQDIAAMPPDDTPLSEAPPEKKKQERELPDWMLDKTTVNELIFSRMFLGQHPMKCIKGVFYDYDGVVDENELGNEIYNILMTENKHFCIII